MFSIGDIVRIKAPEELKGIVVQGGSAIDKWQNRWCIVEDIVRKIGGYRYKLELSEHLPIADDEIACGVPFDQYRWEEFELDLCDTASAEISETEFEHVLGEIE